MSNLKEIKARISSVESVYQIAKAMKMVASSRIKKYETLLVSRRPYTENLAKIMRQIFSAAVEVNHALSSSHGDGNKVGILIVTSEKGLCGAYNNNILKMAERFAKSLQEQGKEIVYYVLGTKAVKYCERRGIGVKWSRSLWVGGDDLGEELYSLIYEDFLAGVFDLFYIASAHAIGKASYDTGCSQFLPFSAQLQEEDSSAEGVDFLIEPSVEKAMELIVPLYLKQSLTSFLVESRYVEYSARLTAMTNATDNAEKLIEELRLNFFRARQSAITTEILEVSAAAAQMAE